jgi:VCBS repeat-containing protein
LLTGNVLNDNDQGADFDVDGDSLFVTLVSGSGPQHGNLSLNADGSFTYQPDHNSNGGDGFSYTIVDPDGETDTATVSILVTPVNDPPVLTLISPQNAFEDVPLAMSGLSVSDDDAAEGNGFMQVTLAVAHGTLHISSTVPGGVESVHLVGNGQRKVVVTAPLDAINATLAAADGLTYVGTLDFHGADTLIALVGDLGNTGTPGVLTDTGSVPISVLSSAEQLTNLNDAVLAIGATGELNRGQIKGLDSSLNAATRNLEQDNLVASSNLIFKFVRQVNAFNNAGLLSNPYTRDLVESSRILIKSIQRSQEDAVGRYPPSPSCWTRSGLCRQQQSSRQPAHGLSIDDLDSLFGDLEFC